MATLRVTTTDDQGHPIPDILVQAHILQDGRCFARTSDGGGYSDLALLGVKAGYDVLLSVQKEGFISHKEYILSPSTDQEVSVTLLPFVQ
jgi:hypothetical protein